MKKNTVIIGALLMVLFVSCGSGPSAASSESSSSGGANAGASTSAAQPVQVPVEVKETVMFGNGDMDEYTTFTYDASDKLVSQERYSASNAMLEQVEFTYADDKGHLTAKITRDVEKKIKSRVVYQYDNQGQLKTEALANKDGKAVSSYEYLYDEKGNRISRIMNSGQNQRMAETRYTYNAQGNPIASETRDAGGTRVISSVKNTYDGGGNLVKQEVFNGSGQVTSVINAVWQNGLEVKNEQSGSDGKVQLRITNEYGSHNELLRKTIENIQGESKQIMQYEYIFKSVRR